MENEGMQWLQENFVGHNLKFSYDKDKKGYVIEGSCKLKNKDVTEIPYKIYKVIGDFDCSGKPNSPSSITKLDNFPEVVDGNFYIDNNKQLKSLKGGPTEVTGSYFCNNCSLKNIDHVATKIGRNLKAFSNPITNADALKNTKIYGFVDLEYTPVYDETPIYDRLVGKYV